MVIHNIFLSARNVCVLLTYTNINIVGQVKMLMAQFTYSSFAYEEPNMYVLPPINLL